MKGRFLSVLLIFLRLLALLTLGESLYAQRLGLRFYTLNDGLPANGTFLLCQDKYGYLWIGSSGGLSRFDGRQFVNYSLADGLPSINASVVMQDSRERLWVGTKAGMAQFINNRFKTYPTSDSVNIAYTFCIIETKTKNVWALTDKGVYEFADSIWKKVTLHPDFRNKRCRNIIESNGELFVNYSSDLYCRDKKGIWEHIAAEQDYGSIFNVMSLQDNEIWVSTRTNIFIIRNHRLIPLYKKNLDGENYFSYFIDSKKRLWLAGESFLKISIPGDWQHFEETTSHGFDYSYGIIEDSNSNFWMGTSEGLLKIRDNGFTSIDRNNSIWLDGIYNIIALPDGSLLLSSGTKSGMLVYDNKSYKKIMPPKSAGNKNYYKDPIDAYTFDERNSLWIVTRYKRFLHYNGGKLEDFSDALFLKTTEHIYDMDYHKKMKEFFICADSTLLYGNSSRLTPFIPRNTGVPIVKPTRVHVTRDGLLLLYIDTKGVYCIDAENNLISLVNETGFDGGKKGIELGVNFYEDHNNSFWITIPGLGIYEYGFTKNKQPFLKGHLTLKEGLQNNFIWSVTSDREDRLWIAGNSGLDILQKNKAGNWEVFNYGNGAELGIDKWDFQRLITDKNGNVWLSSPDKIVKFNTAEINLVKKAPRTIIEKVSLAFKETDWSKLTDSLYSYYQLPFNPVLNYSQNSLSISFNAINLALSNSNLEYSYKLLPLDTLWSISSKIKSVSFAQLPAGKYEFMVRSKDQASGWSQAAVFQFTVTPPFWDKWWFRLITIAVASFIIISIFGGRIRKIKRDGFIENQLKELEMKALKAQMNPHFIYNALNSIQALVADEKKTEAIHYIGSFSRLLRKVLDHSDNSVISLDNELETIGLYIQLEALRLDMQLQYKKIIPENIVTEFERVPPLILQPFVENALWHGLSSKQGEKTIDIAVTTKEDWLVCDITDNGIGRVKARVRKTHSALSHHSKAIEISRKRLINYNQDGSLSPIEFFDLYDNNENPLGTRVTIRIKRKKGLPLV